MYEWANEMNCAVTVCDTKGIILYMNEKACRTFAKHGDLVQEKKKEQEAAKPDPDADYVDDDEDYGYDPEFENDDADSSVDEDDNEPV